MRWIAAILVLEMAVMSAVAQTPAGQKPAFEVASVKPNNSGSLTTRGGFQGCRYVVNNEVLKTMIAWAYRTPAGQILPLDRILGVPKWIDTEHFDVEAKPNNGADSILDSQLLLMVQSLLENRFQLRAHWSKQDFAVYNLVVAKEGLKLHKSENQPQLPPTPRNPVRRCSDKPVAPPVFSSASTGSRETTPPKPQITYGASGVSIDTSNLLVPQLIGIVQPYMDRPIINKTGLTGSYEVKLRFSPERVGGAPVAFIAPNTPSPTTGQRLPIPPVSPAHPSSRQFRNLD